MGTRVSPSNAANMPRISSLCGQNFQTLRASNIHHWRFVGTPSVSHMRRS